MQSINKFFKNNIPINILITIFLLLLFYYKLYLEYKIPILGDELNSILVYSTNIKTLFLKNFPGNVTFYHFFGYLKSIIFGYELLTYRSISFLLVLLNLWVLKKLNFNETKILIFFSVYILTNFTLTVGWYNGYTFSAAIYGVIFFLLNDNKDSKNNKIIFFLLFIQFYNHLVNLYLVIPILIGLFFVEIHKKKFIKEFIILFLFPTIIFYSISILLTGVAILKIEQTSFNYIISFLSKNFENIVLTGFNQIFFYEGYQNSNGINLLVASKEFFNFDKILFLIFVINLIISIYGFFKNRSIFSIIFILHFLMFILINKQPVPRIFTGFGLFYLLNIFHFFEVKAVNIYKIKMIRFLSLGLLVFIIININFKEKLEKSVYGRDINYKENLISEKLLKKNCLLINQNFSEIQKRNYYFNYINKCKKKFILSEFLNYYRS